LRQIELDLVQRFERFAKVNQDQVAFVAQLGKESRLNRRIGLGAFQALQRIDGISGNLIAFARRAGAPGFPIEVEELVQERGTFKGEWDGRKLRQGKTPQPYRNKGDCAGSQLSKVFIRPKPGKHPSEPYILGKLMSERIITLLVQFITHVIDAGGYAGIAALMGLNSSGVPIPSELIMPFSGYLVYLGRFHLLMVTLAGAVGCNLGSAIAYWIGAKGGRPLVERYGKWVLLSHHDLDRMTWFFLKYGSITILLGRMLPVVQTFVAFPAGIARMGRVRFHVYTSLGSCVWYYCLAYVGMKLGEKWHTDPRLYQAFHRFHLAVELALLAGIVWFLWSHIRRGKDAEAA